MPRAKCDQCNGQICVVSRQETTNPLKSRMPKMQSVKLIRSGDCEKAGGQDMIQVFIAVKLSTLDYSNGITNTMTFFDTQTHFAASAADGSLTIF